MLPVYAWAATLLNGAFDPAEECVDVIHYCDNLVNSNYNGPVLRSTRSCVTRWKLHMWAREDANNQTKKAIMTRPSVNQYLFKLLYASVKTIR